MRIADLLARSKPTVSFEFMAPRDESEVEVLEHTVATLAGHAPDWVSVTYRVRTGDKTLELVTRIKRQYHIEAMAHLTCANTADRTRQILNWMEREGVANVLALRGDPVVGDTFTPADPQLTHASDLVTLVKRSGYRFGVGAACSAEKHPESPDLEHEFHYMRLKVESGADFLITPRARGRDQGADRAGPDAHPEPAIAGRDDEDVRRVCAGGAAGRDRRGGRRRRGPRDRGPALHRPVRRAAGGRRAGAALLHLQPRPRADRDPCRAARPAAARLLTADSPD
jgi:hypothetical protein